MSDCPQGACATEQGQVEGTVYQVRSLGILSYRSTCRARWVHARVLSNLRSLALQGLWRLLNMFPETVFPLISLLLRPCPDSQSAVDQTLHSKDKMESETGHLSYLQVLSLVEQQGKEAQ